MTQSLEVRMAHLEGAYEQVNHRLGNVENRLGRLETKVDGLGENIGLRFDQLRTEFDRKFLWMIGLIVVSILIPLTQRFLGH